MTRASSCSRADLAAEADKAGLTDTPRSETVAVVDPISAILVLALIVCLPFWIAAFIYEAVMTTVQRRRERSDELLD